MFTTLQKDVTVFLAKETFRYDSMFLKEVLNQTQTGIYWVKSKYLGYSEQHIK